jgi:membrane protein involved in colicin uptake
MVANNEPSTTKDSRAPTILCDDSGKDGKDGKDEPDYGQIVRDLRRLKHRRKLQEQKIEAEQNSLPDVTSLTTSASDAQRAADEAQSAADEAQRIADNARLTAETAKKAVEDAELKHGQLAADKIDLAKLIQKSDVLRAQLGID